MDIVNDVWLLLQKLIATESFSKSESITAGILEDWLTARGVEVHRYNNNVVAVHRSDIATDATILLNSHHDTVRPGGGWDTDPLSPTIVDNKLIGLGSNDAGAPLMTMLATFIHMRQFSSLNHHVVFAATAEEEISGLDGMALLARDVFVASNSDVPTPTLALVGEPTQMKMAIAEKGLMVLDCTSTGRTGHAARDEGENAIYKAMLDIDWFRTHRFEKTSSMLGEVKMTVTQIEAGSQHNVVPDVCSFVVDVRTTDSYSNGEVLAEVRENVSCAVEPRSTRLQPSSLDAQHGLVAIGRAMGLEAYGSPTLSDQSLLPPEIPSMKIGPGDSARSHTPNEFVTFDELRHGIETLSVMVKRYLQ